LSSADGTRLRGIALIVTRRARKQDLMAMPKENDLEGAQDHGDPAGKKA